MLATTTQLYTQTLRPPAAPRAQGRRICAVNAVQARRVSGWEGRLARRAASAAITAAAEATSYHPPIQGG